MRKEEERFQNSTILEGMTSIRALLSAHKSGVNDRRIYEILYDQSHLQKNPKLIAFLRHRAEEEGFLLTPKTAEEIAAIAVGSTHGGVLAICGERSLPSLSADIKLPENGFFVWIEGIEDPYNFGYAIRSLYAMGVSGILLSERNWLSAAGVVARSSAGASEEIPIYTATSLSTVEYFKKQGYTVVAADTRTEDLLPKTSLPLPILLLVGGEKRGISRAILELADIKVKIPYGRSFDAALSAASAATILGYEIYRQNAKI